MRLLGAKFWPKQKGVKFTVIFHIFFPGIQCCSRFLQQKCSFSGRPRKWRYKVSFVHACNLISLNINERGLPTLSKARRRKPHSVNSFINLLGLFFSWLSFIYAYFMCVHFMVTCPFKRNFVCIHELKRSRSSTQGNGKCLEAWD